MSYVIELHMPVAPVAYVLAQAATAEDARALVDAHLGLVERDDLVIVAVHPVH